MKIEVRILGFSDFCLKLTILKGFDSLFVYKMVEKLSVFLNMLFNDFFKKKRLIEFNRI